MNAMTFNGMSLNGMSLNGVGLNGINLNGIQLNGVDVGAVTLAGSTLRRADGTELPIGTSISGSLSDGREVRLALVAREPLERDVVGYRLALDGDEICGGGAGVFVQGTWDERGARGDSELVTYSCVTGAIGECVTWGYAPWIVGAELHQACTRMVRADYCGDGVAHTETGTPGALCVSEPRFADATSTGEAMLPSCWRAKPACGSLAEAARFGARLGNRADVEDAVLHGARLVCGAGR